MGRVALRPARRPPPPRSSAPGIRPFHGNRQRLDRYDERDFDDMVRTLRGNGQWLVDGTPDYHVPPTWGPSVVWK